MVKTLCEVYSRVVGYMRPVTSWNDSKLAEFKDRSHFDSAFSHDLLDAQTRLVGL
jgi:ribonucleoside-triphosphate reductase